jgi:hypothetical protein
MSRPFRLAALALLALAVLATAGCGNKTSVTTNASTESTYLDLGGMKYQIQMSRYLNGNDVEDKSYLAGVPTGVAPGANEVWFGIWMRVENGSDKPLPVATDYTITDTQGNTYRPVPIDGKVNPFIYLSGPLQPGSVLPDPDSAAGANNIQGSLILFKIKTDSLQNRPLILHITQGGKTVTADIDV